ncbi:enoyl-CoA hydratase-related protein [Saprospiraceae bacterium]|nr:enoyl-CoA hydratase-related protein [Saprospiraceae bacterium]
MNFINMQIDGGVAYIYLNRPDKYNSFVREMALNLQECLKQCAEDESVRCIYLSGEGKAFCAGQDLQEAVSSDEEGMKRIVVEHFNPIAELIVNHPKPIIAAVNGVAAGAGANIALACDIVLAAESASFIQAFSKIGLVPDTGGSWTLPRLVGWQRASALMMTGDKVPAAEAVRMGMIYKYFPNEIFAEESKKMAIKMAKMPTYALQKTKALLRLSAKNNFTEQLDVEGKYQYECSKSYDYSEGTKSFLEKRRPEFKGK